MDDEQLIALKSNGGVIQTVAYPSYLNSKKHKIWQAEYYRILQKVGKEMKIEILPDRRQLFMMEPQRRSDYLKLIAPAIKRTDELKESIASPPVDLADFVDHIDYLVKKIGVEHVGISSDFEGGGGVLGWDDADETFNVTLELVKRGYSETDIKKLWSDNLLRVMKEVQDIAAIIQKEDELKKAPEKSLSLSDIIIGSATPSAPED